MSKKCPEDVQKLSKKKPNKCGYMIYGCPPSFTFGSKLWHRLLYQMAIG